VIVDRIGLESRCPKIRFNAITVFLRFAQSPGIIWLGFGPQERMGRSERTYIENDPTGSDFKNTRNEDLRAGTRCSILPDRSITKRLGWVGSVGNLNFGTSVTMRAEMFGMVGWISRRAEGKRERRILLEGRSRGEGGRCLAELGERMFGVERVPPDCAPECPPR